MMDTAMPGMAPMNEPIQEHRRIRNQWVKQSLTPSSMPVLASIFPPSVTTAVRAIARSQSSGSAKMPSTRGTSGNPSARNRLSSVHRCVPVCASSPTIDSMMPTQPAARPRSGALPDSAATMERPKTANASSSGEPIYSMSGRNMGRLIPMSAAPNRPPISADM
jgi:hypothetical protein